MVQVDMKNTGNRWQEMKVSTSDKGAIEVWNIWHSGCTNKESSGGTHGELGSVDLGKLEALLGTVMAVPTVR